MTEDAYERIVAIEARLAKLETLAAVTAAELASLAMRNAHIFVGGAAVAKAGWEAITDALRAIEQAGGQVGSVTTGGVGRDSPS
jgi:phytoene dehydrogenase-like protein